MTNEVGKGPRPNLVYRIAFPVLRAALQTRMRFVRCGLERVPARGGFMFVANHQSNFDPFAVAFGMPTNRPVSFLAKQEMFRNPIQNWFFRAVHQYPVDRGKPDRGAIRYATDWLGSGGILGIFPQGTRSAPGPVTSAEQGAAFIAFLAMAPAVPVGILYGSKPKGLGRRTVVLVYGEPVDPQTYAELPKRERLERFTEAIVDSINEAIARSERQMENASCA